MASGIHSMHQQRPNVEAKLKTLKNDELKEILKAYGKPVSGIKTALQKRCSEGELREKDPWGGEIR